jgi:hypothetical protein
LDAGDEGRRLRSATLITDVVTGTAAQFTAIDDTEIVVVAGGGSGSSSSTTALALLRVAGIAVANANRTDILFLITSARVNVYVRCSSNRVNI